MIFVILGVTVSVTSLSVSSMWTVLRTVGWPGVGAENLPLFSNCCFDRYDPLRPICFTFSV